MVDFSSPMEEERHIKQTASSLNRTSDFSTMLKGNNGLKKANKKRQRNNHPTS
jgi:hypothetical protein